MKNIFLIGAGFSLEEAKKWATDYLDPITAFLQWASIPMGIIALIVLSASFYGKDEEERVMKKYIRNVLTIIGIAIISTSASILFQIFGLN